MNKVDDELLPDGAKIILYWTGVNIISILGGMLLGSFLNEVLLVDFYIDNSVYFRTFVDIVDKPIQRASVIGLSIGSLVGILGLLVLQKYGIKANGWVLANMLGWGFGLAFLVVLEMYGLNFYTDELLGGGIVGFFQWIILKRYLSKSYWWVIANMLGSFFLLSFIPLGYTFFMIIEISPFYLVAGLVMGVITGANLSWLIFLSLLNNEKV